jgi:hypothetical protein
MPAPTFPAIGLVVLVPLIAWRLYARFRRLVGRQRSSRVRPWITLTLFPALVLLLGYLARRDLLALALLAAALAAGAALGRYGLQKTRFEATPEGLFYTPHAPLGIALLTLFAGRIVYRVFELSSLAPGAPPAGFAVSPATLAIFGLLAGYYVAYAVGLVRWRRAHKRE